MMVACPQCGRLLYADALQSLAEQARIATEKGDVSGALTAWREALALLPHGSRQFQVIAARITALDEQVAGSPAPAASAGGNRSPVSRGVAGAGAIGVFLWKLKALFFGLGKLSTLASMALSAGVYWTIWGWPFAVGVVLSIYVHEMGHVIALRRYGFKAGAPMFIPGLGAVIRLQQQIVNPKEDAEIGLAGPIYGLGAALACIGLWAVTKEPFFAALAGLGAWINLFNLLPFGSLDGGRGFHAMSRTQKLIGAGVVAAAWFFIHDGMLILIGLLAISRAISDKSDPQGSWKATYTYVTLIAALSAVSMMRLHAPLSAQ
ncbi:MAG: Zn-dependent protease [Phycisphaerales bacterium]|nr:Zn-dependent protease [Phycisphaerales bacterium]